jgi:hypothetical protein
MAKVLCVLYDDPVDGYPAAYARDEIPQISSYPGGQTTPSPHGIDFTPGELLGSVSGELGLRAFLEAAGHTLVVTSDKDGPDSVFERELPDADIVISQPFWPAYLTRERIAKAKSLKSGSLLSAQARYAAGTREVLECWFENRPIREEYLIVQGGRLAAAGAHSYQPGDATGGSEEAARFKA